MGAFGYWKYYRESQSSDHKIQKLIEAELPYNNSATFTLAVDYPTDDRGVIMFPYHDKNYYNPVVIIQKSLYFLNGYKQTKDQAYLDRVKIFSDKLIELSEEKSGAMYFPYRFDYIIHEDELDNNEIMKAPWYSGMAQGQALSLYTRLYQITDDQKYLTDAEKIFKSLKKNPGSDLPQVTMVDKDGYYWIEEYPMSSPDHTLNGFIFAIYGLYDYNSLKKDTASESIFLDAVRTVKRYIVDYRNPNDISSYCLKHRHKSLKYHIIHIEQLKMLSRMTGDTFFSDMANNFYQDYHRKKDYLKKKKKKK